MGQSIIFEYEDGDLTTDAAHRLGVILEDIGRSTSDEISVRVEIDADCPLEDAMDNYLDQVPSDLAEEPATDVDVEETQPTVESDGQTASESDESSDSTGEDTPLPTINPGTHKYATGAVLYHSDEPLTTREISEHLQGTEHERDVSPISSDLHQMYKDHLIDREGSPYRHELTEDGIAVLEKSDAPIEPNPFEESSDQEDSDLEDEAEDVDEDEDELEEETETDDDAVEEEFEEVEIEDTDDEGELEDDVADENPGSPTDALLDDQEEATHE